jgi:hypothetical protein
VGAWWRGYLASLQGGASGAEIPQACWGAGSLAEQRAGGPTRIWGLTALGAGCPTEWSGSSAGLQNGGLAGGCSFSKSWCGEAFHELGVQSANVSALPGALS